MPEIAGSAWPLERLGQALEALANRAGLGSGASATGTCPAVPTDAANVHLGPWLDWAGQRLGVELEEVAAPVSGLTRLLQAAGPALIIANDADPAQVLLLVTAKRGRARLLGPDGRLRWVPLAQLGRVLRAQREDPLIPEIEALLADAGIVGRRRARAARVILDERLAGQPIGGCWLLRTPPGAGFVGQLLRAGVPQGLLVMLGVFALLYGLEILGWGLIGRGALEGRIDPGWLFAWALLLLVGVPLELAGRALQGRIALVAGALIKRRLLAGALNLEIDAVRRQGAGHLLGQVIESQALESLALNGGFATVVALVELTLAAWVLSLGAGGGLHLLLLGAWLILTVALGWRYARALARWTQARFELTHDLVEAMVGHRTRLAQESPAARHVAEDQALEHFLALSVGLDRRLVPLFGGLPRGWLVIGMMGLAPAFTLGSASAAELAIGLGGVLLAWRAIGGAVSGLAALARAAVAWEAVAPLFRAAGTAEAAAAPPPPSVAPNACEFPGTAALLVQVQRLAFRYGAQGEPVVRASTFNIRRGERILLEGPSGGGKSTLAALLAGLRRPQSGLLLLGGLDRSTLGTGWRALVAAAPQFHENHVLSGTLAFNLLLGRRWPPSDDDLTEAEDLCHDLGLGPLLERMPAGLMQMVGETGWQLSHGERSRLYLARALLQGAPLVVLDESFAALDPQTLALCLSCAWRRVDTLLVIAHP